MLNEKEFYNKSAEKRWLQKKIHKSTLLYDGHSLENVEFKGTGSLSIDHERGYQKPYSLKYTASTKVDNISPRPSGIIRINLNGIDLSNYNRISAYIYPEAIGHQNFYFHISIGNTGFEELHAPSLTPNEWNHVVFEINHIKRNHVDKMTITPTLMGCQPDALPDYFVYISEIWAESVEPEYEEGWNLDDRMAYCHSGYYPMAKKIALTQVANANDFLIFNDKDELIFKKPVKEIYSNIGNFFELDFTELINKGNYYLKIDNRITDYFTISDEPFKNSILKSINFLKMLRCGEEVFGVHTYCHLNARTLHANGSTVPCFGGWHDAGDLSQFEICTAEIAHAVLDLANNLANKDEELSKHLLAEARVGINWLLRTRFGDGYRALKVLHSVWRDNILESDNKAIYNEAENGPFENFLASAAEAVASRLYQATDQNFSNWCRRVAIEDFHFAKDGYEQGIYTKRWGPSIDVQVCGAGIIAACEIYTITKDESFLKIAKEYAKVVLACQQQELPKWERPIRGFFYEDQKHKNILTYEHRGHEQTPIMGLVRLCEVAPNDDVYQTWLNGLMLYREYIMKTYHETYPYGLLPAHIYLLDKINIDRFTVPSSYGTKEKALEDLKQQAKRGIKLDENVYLRMFPIAIQRRGFHATLLSKTKGITALARVLKDKELLQIALNQIEWILGKNPFASSTMYGEGSNYHPLYVAFSRQVVGSLPVGIKTFGDNDAPFWPTINNAVYKEIWGHTTGKFLHVLADIVDFY